MYLHFETVGFHRIRPWLTAYMAATQVPYLAQVGIQAFAWSKPDLLVDAQKRLYLYSWLNSSHSLGMDTDHKLRSGGWYQLFKGQMRASDLRSADQMVAYWRWKQKFCYWVEQLTWRGGLRLADMV